MTVKLSATAIAFRDLIKACEQMTAQVSGQDCSNCILLVARNQQSLWCSYELEAIGGQAIVSAPVEFVGKTLGRRKLREATGDAPKETPPRPKVKVCSPDHSFRFLSVWNYIPKLTSRNRLLGLVLNSSPERELPQPLLACFICLLLCGAYHLDDVQACHSPLMQMFQAYASHWQGWEDKPDRSCQG